MGLGLFVFLGLTSFAQDEGEGGPLTTADWKAMADWLDFRNDTLEKPNFFTPTGGGSSNNSTWSTVSRDVGSPRTGRTRNSTRVSAHDGICDHEEYRRNHNTPSRVPSRLPTSTTSGDTQTTSVVLRGSRTQKLIQASLNEASECRPTASHVRNRTGASRLCGPSRSKGKCYAAVKDALKEAGITPNRLPGGSAHMAHSQGYLRQAGFVNRVSEFNRFNAPVGCVLVYAGGSHGHGHIEVKAAQDRYCSDYCSPQPLRSYTLKGVYCLPE